MLGIILLILVLVCLNALYVAAEFASVAVRTIRIQALAEEGNTTAARLLPHLQDAHSLDRYVAACQIGITVSSLVLGSFGQKRLSAPLEALFLSWGIGDPARVASVTAVTVLVLLTAFQVILGELLPKAIALRFPERVALTLTYPMLFSLWLFAYFIRFLNGTGNLILKWMGISSHGHRHVHTPAELMQIVQSGAEQGSLDRQESVLLQKAFRFADTLAREVMVSRSRVVGCDLQQPTSNAIQALLGSRFSRFPAYREDLDHFEGVLHIKDLLGIDPPESLQSLLRPALTMPASATAEQVFEEMRSKRTQMAILIDEYGGFEGMVTMEDLCELLVGDIRDELDSSAPRLTRLDPNTWRAKGELSLRELEDQLDLEFDLEDVHSLGGLLMHHLKELPKVGSLVEYHGFEFSVEEMRGHGVAVVHIKKVGGRDV